MSRLSMPLHIGQSNEEVVWEKQLKFAMEGCGL